MSRFCPVSGKGVLSGNNVSHANNKTRRRFLPNLQQVSFLSEVLGCVVRLRLTTRGLRTVEKRGGIDAYLQTLRASQMDADLAPLKRSFERARARRAQAQG